MIPVPLFFVHCAKPEIDIDARLSGTHNSAMNIYMTKYWIAGIASALLLTALNSTVAAPSSPATANTVTLKAVKDTLLDEDRPDNNMGNAYHAAKVASFRSKGYNRIMLVEFDLSSLASTNIAQATLRLHCSPSGWDHSIDATFLFFGMQQPWEEGSGVGTIGSETLDGASWNSRDGSNTWNGGSIVVRGKNASGNFDAAPFATKNHTTYEEWLNTWIEVDATPLVRQWAGGARPNHGIAVCALGQSTNNAYTQFTTREYGQDGYSAGEVAPQLVLKFAPATRLK
jgi:hypothetical protein